MLLLLLLLHFPVKLYLMQSNWYEKTQLPTYSKQLAQHCRCDYTIWLSGTLLLTTFYDKSVIITKTIVTTLYAKAICGYTQQTSMANQYFIIIIYIYFFLYFADDSTFYISLCNDVKPETAHSPQPSPIISSQRPTEI